MAVMLYGPNSRASPLVRPTMPSSAVLLMASCPWKAERPAKLITRPQLRSTIEGMTAWQTTIAPRSSTLILRFQVSKVISAKGADSTGNRALLTRTSTPPNSAEAFCASPRTCSSSPVSQTAVRVFTPDWAASRAICSSASPPSMLASARFAPSAAKDKAVALPRLRVASVISTVFPASPVCKVRCLR